MTGLIGSITHYHSEGLECLDHANEQHYVQNETFCPICTLVVSLDFDANLSVEVELTFTELVLNVNEFSTPYSLSFLKPGRAPPFMV